MKSTVVERGGVRICGRVLGRRAGDPAAGFTLIEILTVIGIMLLTAIIALPLLQNATSGYQMRGAVNAISGAIQSTRFRAISNGYPFRIVFNMSNSTYQIWNSTCGYSSPCWATVGSAVPFSSSSGTVAMVISGSPGLTSNTLDFQGGGLVLAPTETSPAGSSLTFNLNFKNLTETMTVSPYGSINVSP